MPYVPNSVLLRVDSRANLLVCDTEGQLNESLYWAVLDAFTFFVFTKTPYSHNVCDNWMFTRASKLLFTHVGLLETLVHMHDTLPYDFMVTNRLPKQSATERGLLLVILCFVRSFRQRWISDIRHTKSQNVNASRLVLQSPLCNLAVSFVQSIKARCCFENEDVFVAALTGDASTTSEW